MDAMEQGAETSLPTPADLSGFQFQRPEWTLFRNIGSLPQRAGVPAGQLRRLVLKELADNALDAGADVDVTFGRLPVDGGFFVEDNGPGMDPKDICRLFSINRDLTSSKLRRMPSRGAMGNGLRVVSGAAIASSGSLAVITAGQRFDLHPLDDGTTRADVRPAEFRPGMRVEIVFGPGMPQDDDPFAWVNLAARVTPGPAYSGKPSPWWYDGGYFFELLQAAGALPVRSLIAEMDGCTGPKAGRIAAAFKGRACASLSRDEALALLLAAREEAKPVRAERLGEVSRAADLPEAYASEAGEFDDGQIEPKARIPFLVQSWVGLEGDADAVHVMVNRTPIISNVWTSRERGKLEVYGAGLRHAVDFPKDSAQVFVNITTPYCPITSDGKSPNLAGFAEAVMLAIRKAGARARRATPRRTTEKLTQKAVVLSNLDAAIDKASGGQRYRFNQRQLFYIARPAVMAALGVELTYKNFDSIITDYETEHGDVPGMYRDARGTLYHPHIAERPIPLGTLAVEAYERPRWTFNKILYIEKEGPFEALKAARWPERHDCALLTSKGYTTRAVKDLLDFLGEDGEPLTVFCVHDADAAGTMIHQTLQEETRARPTRRSVEVLNLGLEPWEAVAMGLEVEGVEKKKRNHPVADYVLERPDGAFWRHWLKSKRVELNALTTADFIRWLDEKMAAHASRKVLPPADIIAGELRERTADHLRRDITARVLREAGIDDRVRQAMETVPEADGATLANDIAQWHPLHEDRLWSAYVDGLARSAAESAARG